MDEMDRPDAVMNLGGTGILAFNMGELSSTNMGGRLMSFIALLMTIYISGGSRLHKLLRIWV